ncbi:50S ribosomal protein L28 [Mycoplasmatota bacterium]|nr:50S ribosomal protein L28 [Mycoplasmatota bacterium]
MAKECYITGKKTVSGNNKSHSLHTTKRQFKPNLQKIKIEEDGKVKTVYVSARGLKSGLKSGKLNRV